MSWSPEKAPQVGQSEEGRREVVLPERSIADRGLEEAESQARHLDMLLEEDNRPGDSCFEALVL